MKKNKKSIPFSEFRQLLERLGYKLKRTDDGEIFHHAKEGLLLFRRYGDDEPVYPGDLLRTRKFLDLRGLLEEADFDTFMQRANKPDFESVSHYLVGSHGNYHNRT